ncbi:MAG: hypothetical protein HN430_04000, partial [Halieaceae bacterium]|nr:hypothetical protein [Halieaceae bacterium]
MKLLNSSITGLAVALTLGLVLAACSDSNSNSPALPEPEPEPPEPSPTYLPIAQAEVSTPPDSGVLSLLAQSFDLSDIGYEDQEYFIGGEASAFTNLNEFSPDGFWEAEPAEQQAYRTRIVVQRPEEGAAFSGTVIVEWLNV